MIKPIHTSDARHFKHLWIENGGVILPVRRTGEVRFAHHSFPDGIRANGRRKDVPAVLLSRLNQIMKLAAANDCSIDGRPYRD